jgi:hypothetical protein
MGDEEQYPADGDALEAEGDLGHGLEEGHFRMGQAAALEEARAQQRYA